jgi:hypothetical protein
MVARTMTAEDVQVKLQRMVTLRDTMRDVQYAHEDVGQFYAHGELPTLDQLERDIEDFADYWGLEYDA